MPRKCFIHLKVNFEKKNAVLPIDHEEFPFLVPVRNTIRLQHFVIIQFFAPSSVKRSLTDGYKRKEISNFQLKKVVAVAVAVAVAYERWSLTRGSTVQQIASLYIFNLIIRSCSVLVLHGTLKCHFSLSSNG